MNERTKVLIAISLVAFGSYMIGYNRAQARAIRDLGAASTKEAMIYLATQDAIRHRFG